MPRDCASVALAALLVAAGSAGVRGQEASAPAVLMADAARAAGAFEVGVAISHLHELVFEHPRSPEAPSARLHLARLLTLEGDLPAALVQCQLVKDSVPPDRPEWREAADLMRTLARRWRDAGAGVYTRSEAVGAGALGDLNTPAAVLLQPDGSIVIVDSSRRRLFRVGDTQVPLPQAAEPVAGTLQPDGRMLVVTRAGGVVSGDGPPQTLTSSARGRSQPLRRIESVAVDAAGDLLVADREVDSLLRCARGTTSCAPWGPTGRVRVVKVDRAGLVYTIDDRQATARVIDPDGRLLLTIGATTPGIARVGRFDDIAADGAYGVYLLDSNQQQVHVIFLSAGPDGRLSARVQRPVAVSQALRNPSAVAVTPGGELFVAGRSGLIRYH